VGNVVGNVVKRGLCVCIGVMEYLWVRFRKLLIRENIMNNNRIQENQFMTEMKMWRED